MEYGNEQGFEIDSKLYVASSKKKMAVKVILNIVLGMLILIFLFVTLMDGFSIYNVGKLCVAILVVTYYNMGIKSGYQSTKLNLYFLDSGINLVYHNVIKDSKCGDMVVQINCSDIRTLEKNDNLKSIRFIGSFKTNCNGRSGQVNEWVLYANDYMERILTQLREYYGIEVVKASE